MNRQLNILFNLMIAGAIRYNPACHSNLRLGRYSGYFFISGFSSPSHVNEVVFKAFSSHETFIFFGSTILCKKGENRGKP